VVPNPPGAPVAADQEVPRPAATVMVVRDGDGDGDGDGDRVGAGAPESSIEVLVLRRNLRSDFVGGVYVFPGGAVDEDDGRAEAMARCAGRSDADASRLLGLPVGGLAYWVAAVRESFEEAGLLLATRSDGGLVSLEEPGDQVRFQAHRDALNAGERTFLEICAAEDLLVAAGEIHYFAHWITPLGAPRRYDTRFFVTRAPAGQEAVHDAGETIADAWVRPADALARHRAGEIDLILPTVMNLQAVMRFASCDALLDAARTEADRVPTTEPRVIAEGNGVRIVLPGDPGYDAAPEPGEIAGTPAGRDPAAMQEAIRQISRAANRPGTGEQA